MSDRLETKKRAIIAMSGGVDSSVAAFLMKQQGYDCMGVMMKLYTNETIDGSCTDSDAVPRANSCCTLDDAEDARSVAFALGMPFQVFNFSDRFKECVIDRFVDAYRHGATPNPCIDCNRFLKFDKLFLRAKELGYPYVVTGHYARTDYDEKHCRFLLKRALDPAKDQSYVLYSLTQEQLAHVQFPLGGIEKCETRRIAEENGFINAHKHDSQDICFVQNGSYADFIEQYTGQKFPSGEFVDLEGHVLGQHKGVIRYTIGQRKGLGLALPAPLYVTALDLENNRVILGPHEALFSDTLDAKDINLISVPHIDGELRVQAKVRYRQPAQWATVTQPDADTLHVVFDEPQRAITNGQAVVLYDGDIVVGGGTIMCNSSAMRQKCEN